MAVLTELPPPAAPKPQRFPLRRERDLAIRAAVRFLSLEALLLPFVLLLSPRHFVAFGFAASVMLSAWNSSLYLLADLGKLMHVQDLRDEQAKKDHDTP